MPRREKEKEKKLRLLFSFYSDKIEVSSLWAMITSVVWAGCRQSRCRHFHPKYIVPRLPRVGVPAYGVPSSPLFLDSPKFLNCIVTPVWGKVGQIERLKNSGWTLEDFHPYTLWTKILKTSIARTIKHLYTDSHEKSYKMQKVPTWSSLGWTRIPGSCETMALNGMRVWQA